MIGLQDLEGAWALHRRIEDRHAGLTGALEGQATWRADDKGLRQEEQGVLRYGTAAPMQASRVYLWRETEEGLAVFFEDGRPFHQLSEGRVRDRHRCDPDLYDVRYAFTDWPEWEQVWRVTGPRKDALITSRFRRLG